MTGVPLTPVTIEDFSGLNLIPESGEVGAGGAIDLLNVDFDVPGRVRSRDGTAQFNTSTLSSTGYSSLWGSSVSSFGTADAELLAVRYSNGTTVGIDQITTAGVATNVGSVTAGANTFCASRVDYGVDPASAPAGGPRYSLLSFPAVTLQSIPSPTTGSGLAAASGTPGKPHYVAVTPTSQRLVGAGYFSSADTPSGAHGSRSTVTFSDPSSFTWNASNWVQLDPGDGQVIVGAAVFHDNTWVFKNGAAYMFYGESTDSTGGVEFLYRKFKLPVPIVDPTVPLTPSRFVVAGPDAIYYSTPNGLWRINETGPTRFSTPIDRVFQRDAPIPADLLALDPSSTPPGLSWAQGRLWVSYTNSQGQARQLVYDPRFGQWTVYDLPAVMVSDFGDTQQTHRDAAYYVAGSGNNNVYVQNPTLTTDNGTAISSFYQGGFFNMGSQAQKRVRQTHLWGSGSPTWSLLTDYGTTDSVAAAVTLGTAATNDDFSTNTIGNYAFDAGSGTLSVSGGALVPSTTATKNFYRTAFPGRLTDFQFTLKFTTGATASSYRIDMYKRLDAQNYAGLVFSSGSGVSVQKLDTGTLTALSSLSGAPTLSATTSYWLRVKIVGNVFTAEYWPTTPFSGGTPGLTETFTLTGADATKFGQGIAGDVGVRFTPSGGTDWKLDEFVIEPSTTTIKEGYDRQARRGRLFSFKLSGITPWVVTRLVLDVASPRDEALKSS